MTRTDTTLPEVFAEQLWPVHEPDGGVVASQLIATCDDGIVPKAVVMRFTAATTWLRNMSLFAGQVGPPVVPHVESVEPIQEASTLASRNSWFSDGIAEITAETEAAARERDPAKRNAMYIDLQTKLQKDSPLINLFQAISQTVQHKNVKGFIAGPNPDTVFFRLVSK